MFKPILSITLLALNFIACKTHTKVVTVKEDTKPKTVEVNYGDKTGSNKFKVLENRVFVNNSVSFNGVGKAYLFAGKEEFEKIFGYAEVNATPMPAIDWNKNQALAIIGQTTEYMTTFSVKSTYASPEGYIIRIQEHQEANKGTSSMRPHLLLEIPKSYAISKFIVYIDQKMIELENNKK